MLWLRRAVNCFELVGCLPAAARACSSEEHPFLSRLSLICPAPIHPCPFLPPPPLPPPHTHCGWGISVSAAQPRSVRWALGFCAHEQCSKSRALLARLPSHYSSPPPVELAPQGHYLLTGITHEAHALVVGWVISSAPPGMPPRCSPSPVTVKAGTPPRLVSAR